MSTPLSWEDGRGDRPYPGIESRRLDLGANTYIRYRFAPHSTYPMHAHVEEQTVIVLSGALTLRNGEEDVQLAAGGLAHTPGGLPHGITAGPGGAEFLNVVHPRRQG